MKLQKLLSLLRQAIDQYHMIEAEDHIAIGISGGKAGSGSAPIARPKKPSSTRKYICPCCGNSFRATKTLRVLCMDCNVQFEEVR